jgi:heterodisulfide reductase subunit A-like polyferredoxin
MKFFIKVLFAYVLLQPFYAFSESEGLKILVVGAGISGLGVARDLHDSGYKVTDLEPNIPLRPHRSEQRKDKYSCSIK